MEVKEMAKFPPLMEVLDKSAAVQDIVGKINMIVENIKPTHCFAGLTSWFREAENKEKIEDFFRQNLPKFKLLKLSGEDESHKESVAVTFAAEQSKIGRPDMQVAAGGGSMQLVQGGFMYS